MVSESRRKARVNWPIKRAKLEDENQDTSGLELSPEERLAMMWKLAQQLWSLSGKPFPDYRRSEMPGTLQRKPQ